MSVDVVRKAEQGRQTPGLPTLHKLAAALDVEVSTLLRKPSTLPAPTEHSGALAMRRAATSIVDDLLDTHPDTLPASPRPGARGRHLRLGELLGWPV